MSIVSEIERIKNNISSAYSECNDKKATMPNIQNSENLPSTIASITGGANFEITNASYLFYTNYRLDYLHELCDLIDESCQMFYRTFSDCDELVEVPLLYLGSSDYIYNMFSNCPNITTIHGLADLGKAYWVGQNANYARYSLDLSVSTKLTYESLMTVINDLYDIKSKGCKAQQLILGDENLAKLTADEIGIATSKGWAVS